MTDVADRVVTDRHTHRQTDTHTDRQTDRQTDTQDNYRNPPAHARRGLITKSQLKEGCPPLVFIQRVPVLLYETRHD